LGKVLNCARETSAKVSDAIWHRSALPTSTHFLLCDAIWHRSALPSMI
jgi:hypothetical protein